MSSAAVTVPSIVRRSNRRKRKYKPWERKGDPRQMPSIEELDATAMDDDIDDAIDQVIAYYGGVIIRQFRPERWWLWRRFRGTVLVSALESAFYYMCCSVALCWWIQRVTGSPWTLGLAPDADSHKLIQRLKTFQRVWSLQMNLTTFILTFFLQQAYSSWRQLYNIGRAIQGRINDISLLLATHAKRHSKTGSYTPAAEALLDQVAGYLRAFHALMWASCAKRFRVLLTDRGLRRMVERGILSVEQKEILDRVALPLTQKHTVFLQWALICVQKARRENVLVGGPGLEQLLLDKFCALRAQYGSIGDLIDARIPLAYAHFVQILVDSFLFFAPVAQYAELGTFSILSVGILTLFYSGLLDLSKVFLDPLDNEDYCIGSVYLDLGVLIRESNAGTIKWKNGGENLPTALAGGHYSRKPS